MKQERRLLLLESLLLKSASLTVFVGCGIGEEFRLVESRVRVGIDSSTAALMIAKHSKAGNLLVLADAHRLPLREEIADQVVISETLEHLRRPIESLDEILRILRAGARTVVTTPNELSSWGFSRRIGEMILRRRLRAADQPIDNWWTVCSLRRLLEGRFQIISVRGAWYLPPLGKGRGTIESKRLAAILRRMIGIDLLLGRLLPRYGHLIGLAVVATVPKPRLMEN